MQFLFLWKGRFVGFKGFGILISDEITLGRTISGLYAIQPTRNELLGKKIWHLSISRLGMIMDILFASQIKSSVLIEINVAFHTEKTDTYLAGLYQ